MKSRILGSKSQTHSLLESMLVSGNCSCKLRFWDISVNSSTYEDDVSVFGAGPRILPKTLTIT